MQVGLSVPAQTKQNQAKLAGAVGQVGACSGISSSASRQGMGARVPSAPPIILGKRWNDGNNLPADDALTFGTYFRHTVYPTPPPIHTPARSSPALRP